MFVVRMGPGISANNLRIDLLIGTSHDPSMYTLSMHIGKLFEDKEGIGLWLFTFLAGAFIHRRHSGYFKVFFS